LRRSLPVQLLVPPQCEQVANMPSGRKLVMAGQSVTRMQAGSGDGAHRVVLVTDTESDTLSVGHRRAGWTAPDGNWAELFQFLHPRPPW
jgi:hypothetical protein